jgi:NADH:ubiquinone oxidoreductase subunit H
MNPVLVVLSVVVVLAVAATVVHLLLTWMERRGWIWYRTKNRPRPSSLGLLEEIYQPSVEHVTEQQVTQDTEADQAAQGEPEDGNEDP